jgi:SAM-dependent methyltransferase
MSPANPALEAVDLPIRIGEAEDFARIQAFFQSSGFDEANVCRVLKLRDLAEINAVQADQADLTDADSPRLALLIRLFLFLEVAQRAEAEALIDAAVLESLLALSLIRFIPTTSNVEQVDGCYATVLLTPVRGMLIASDRRHNPDGTPFAPADVVFPASWVGTLRFLRTISRSPARIALDLGTGSGAAALVLSEHVDTVVASDVTARSVFFTAFNSRLNQRFNVEIVQGDLYEAIAGRAFDRIVSHPPYAPSLSSTQIFRDAGESGELLIRRIVEGLHEHLNPGGTFYSVCAVWDADEGLCEARARSWLGAAQNEFDLIFAVTNTKSSEQLAKELVNRNSPDVESEINRWNEIFTNAGFKQLVYCVLVIHRRSEESARSTMKPLTLRTVLSAETDGACFDWALSWHHWRTEKAAGGELLSLLSRTTPRPGRSLRGTVVYTTKSGKLGPADVMLESAIPFLAETRVELWMLMAINEFDGNRTVEEVYEELCAKSAMPNTRTPEDFTQLVAQMIERGYLEFNEPALIWREA